MTTTRVHVHLFHGADPRHYRKGDDIGCLYGYHHAQSDAFALTYSQDGRESAPVRLMRRAMKALLGFDFVHTWRNRVEILRSDVIWTHTEHEHLSVALLLRLFARRVAQPLLIAQSVWLIDKWPEYGALRRWCYRKLIDRADLLTTLATDNAARCETYFGRAATPLLYGLNTRDFPPQMPLSWVPHTPLRIAAIGNDRDRDWTTLVDAFRDDPRYHIRIATRRRLPRTLHASNVEIGSAPGLARQKELYHWADLVIVPLRPNTHASGITVMLEAAALGKPLVATDVGALTDYFPHDAVRYVPAFDVSALRYAVECLAAEPEDTLAQARAAALHLRRANLTTEHYAAQHVAITRDLLRRAAAQAGEAAAHEALAGEGARPMHGVEPAGFDRERGVAPTPARPATPAPAAGGAYSARRDAPPAARPTFGQRGWAMASGKFVSPLSSDRDDAPASAQKPGQKHGQNTAQGARRS